MDKPLLELAAERFDVFLTVDRRFVQTVDIASYDIGVVIVRLPNNLFDSFLSVVDRLNEAIVSVRPREAITVWSPEMHH